MSHPPWTAATPAWPLPVRPAPIFVAIGVVQVAATLVGALDLVLLAFRSDLTATAAASGMIVGILVLLVAFGLFAALPLGERLRRLAWLEGTVPVRRGLFGTRRVDLARASVNVRERTLFARPRLRVWTLFAREEATGVRAWLPLDIEGHGPLPVDSLRALAWAVGQGAPGAGGEHDAVARWLRTQADVPAARAEAVGRNRTLYRMIPITLAVSCLAVCALLLGAVMLALGG